MGNFNLYKAIPGMNKEALRAACKEAGIKYGKMNNDEMKTALKAHYYEPEAKPSTLACMAQQLCNATLVPMSAAPRGKIERNRPEQNGVKRPSIGGVCRKVWDALDGFMTETKQKPTVRDAREIAEANGWNPRNATIEFYYWKRFTGI